MKKIIFIIPILFLVFNCFSQMATQAYVNNAIDSFAHTLDSVSVKRITTTSSTSGVIDVVDAISQKPTVYYLFLGAINNSLGDIHYWEKTVIVRKNSVGKTILEANIDGTNNYTEPSLKNCSWIVLYVNGQIQVKVNGLNKTSINWTLYKQIKFAY